MIKPPPHTDYFISAIYVSLLEVTHYIVHKNLNPGVTGGVKMTKTEVFDLVENSGLPVYVWEWNYTQARFQIGKKVNCNLDYHQKKYLWINEKDPKTKDLKHLIKMDWFSL